MSHLETIGQLAALATETTDAGTRAALLRAVQDHARKAQLEGPRAATLLERCVAVAPDCLALLGFALSGFLHIMAPETAGALALAVVTGRLYPRPGAPPSSPASSRPTGAPPSGLVTLAAASLELAMHLKRSS